MNIIFCGFKNCGKSSVGAMLAKQLHYHFVDTDDVIKEYYARDNNEILNPAEIYKKHGEQLFRQLESDVIKALEKVDDRVIALGGGSVLNPANVTHLHTIGKIIYLRGSLELLKQRFLAAPTPSFIDAKDPVASFEKTYNERYKTYEKIADIIIDIDDKRVDEIVNEVLRIIF